MRRKSGEPKPKRPFPPKYPQYDTSHGHGNVEEWQRAWKGMGHSEATVAVGKDSTLKIMGFDAMPSKTDLDTRFRELVKQHHPDHGGDPEMFKKVHAAWSLLSEQF